MKTKIIYSKFGGTPQVLKTLSYYTKTNKEIWYRESGKIEKARVILAKNDFIVIERLRDMKSIVLRDYSLNFDEIGSVFIRKVEKNEAKESCKSFILCNDKGEVIEKIEKEKDLMKKLYKYSIENVNVNLKINNEMFYNFKSILNIVRRWINNPFNTLGITIR